MSTRKIALLIFAFSIEEEVKQKPFLAQKGLVQALSRHTKNIAINSGLPILHYDETKQIGTDFGTRFSNAIQHVYDSGYDAVITIGNDCPHLKTNHIIQAKKALENGSTVLGPTYDGGFYLLGLSKEHFNHKAFLNYSWNTDAVFQEINTDFLKSHYKCFRLEKLNDIDYFSVLENNDFHTILNVELRKIIQILTAKRIRSYANSNLNEFELIPSIIYNKGSPLLYSI